MNTIPYYEHTISFPETIFIDNVNGSDIYYRKGFYDCIDIRHSNIRSDYVSWTFKKIELLQVENPIYINHIIPESIFIEAKELAKNMKEFSLD